MTNSTNMITNISEYDVEYLINSQLSVANYLLPTETSSPKSSHNFYQNKNIWDAILNEEIRPGMEIRLESFYITEWFPRSPGLYFTETGRQSRDSAHHQVEKMEMNQSESKYAVDADGSVVTVYNPWGKIAMLNGGLGTLRLKPVHNEHGQAWFMCATSNGISHEGVPLLVSHDIFQKCIDQIATTGSWHGTIIGQLKFISDKIVSLYSDYTDVPQLYLEVEQIVPEKAQNKIYDIAVSIAVSFISSYEGEEKLYASYVFFDPSRKESFNRNVNWMQDTYVEGEYRGKIVTDFDEQRSHFPDAVFSLEKIMDFNLDKNNIDATLNKLHNWGNTEMLFEKMANAKSQVIYINGDINTKGSGNVIAIGSKLKHIGTESDKQ